MTPDVESANRRSKHDHGTPAGDALAEACRVRAFDLAGAIAAELVIAVHASNKLGVSGTLGDYATVAALLANARDAVKAHRIQPGKTLTVPGRDVGMPFVCSRITVEGPIDYLEFTLSVLDRVRAELDEQHPLEAEHARTNKARIEI